MKHAALATALIATTLAAAVMAPGGAADEVRAESPRFQAQGHGKGPLSWKLLDKEAITYDTLYTVDESEVTEVKDGPERVQLFRPANGRHLYFGYQLTQPGGMVNTKDAPALETALLEAAFRVPGKAASRGTKWTETIDLDLRSPFNLKCQVEVQYTALKRVEGPNGEFECFSFRIDGIKGDTAVLPLKQLIVNGETVFDGRLGRAHRITYTATGRGDLTVAAASNVPQHKIDWRIQYSADITLGGEPANVLENAALMERVRKSIEKGRDYLQGKDRDGRGVWRPYGKHDLGMNGLVALTLVKCGVRRDDPKLLRMFEEMTRMEPVTTYDASVYVLAIEAMVTPESEDRAFLEGKKIAAFERPLTEVQRAELQRMLDYLIKCQNQKGGFRYDVATDDKPDEWDMSCQQYVALALNSIRRCGLTITPAVWGKLYTHTLAKQATTGPEVALTTDAAREGKGKVRPRYAPKKNKARGFGYVAPGSATGGMTAAGVATLATILDALNEMKADKDRAEALECSIDQVKARMDTLREAIADGVAWLTVNCSLTTNPGGNGSWYYYYLYALERACVLADQRWLGDKDWYAEGAAVLTQTQTTEGTWGTGGLLDADTYFALLFLKRGTVPPRQKVLTGSR